MTFEAILPSGNPAIVGFIATTRCSKDENVTKRNILDSMVEFFGSDANEPIDIIVQDWSKVEFNGGCPVTYSCPGVMSSYNDACLREPHERIFWAGTETAVLNRGFVDGAISSGIRAAHESLRKLDPHYKSPKPTRFQDIIMPGAETASRNEFIVLYAMLTLVTSASVLTLGGGVSYLAWNRWGEALNDSVPYIFDFLSKFKL